MNDSPIVFMDSGVGGLPYLEWVRNALPDEYYIYVADNQHFPYGEKNAEELTDIITSLITRITVKFSPKLIVIACNTASVVALSYLREKFGIPFVGVVPAVKPAVEKTESGAIALIATTKTINDQYTDELINKFAGGCKVFKSAEVNIVDYIENRFLNSSEEEKEAVAEESVRKLSGQGIDKLVLGCTHFLLLKKQFEKVLGDRVEVIDSADGVGRQVLRILERNSLQGPGKAGNELYVTDPISDDGKYKKFAGIYSLEWRGVI